MTWPTGSALIVALVFCAFSACAAEPPLIVVQDLGGTSALPYYRALHMKVSAEADSSQLDTARIPAPPARTRYSENDLLPVHSQSLTPGPVTRREIAMPRLTPIFLVGDDDRSRDWLAKNSNALQFAHASGFVVNVDTQQALDSLRRLVPELTLNPASGDDLAGRLHLNHYPVLITSTAIEQ